jgi:hypothetical protein
MIQVIDNILSEDQSIDIHSLLLKEHAFPWFLNYNLTTQSDVSTASGFSHVMYNDRTELSHYTFHVLPILYNAINHQNLKLNDIIQIRSFLQLPTNNPGADEPHIDRTDIGPYLACLYYVNDSDGDTIFYDNDKNVIHTVSPKRNTCVLFDGSILHSASRPANNLRCVINFNFRVR